MRRLLAIAVLAVVPGGAGTAPAAIPPGDWELLYVTGRVDDAVVRETPRIMLLTSRGGPPRQLAIGAAPEWSPDGTQIAFNGIQVMRADGTGRRRVTPGVRPTWSPDGRWLAFVSGKRIGVVAADGAMPRLLPGSDEQVSGPAWSPDGRRLAYVTREQGDADIAIVNTDGTGKVVFGDPPVTQSHDRWDEEQPRWSPDGVAVSFTRRYVGGGHAPGSGDLWRTSVSGAGVMLASGCCAEWSSDGTRLLFVEEANVACVRSIRCGSEPGDVAVMRADGSGKVVLTGDSLPDSEPRWTPGERHVLFLSARDTRRAFDVEPHESSSRITNAYLTNADGTCAKRLTAASRARTVVHARLRPGSSISRLHCTDLSLSIVGPDRLARATRFTTSLTVSNTGDRAAGASVVTIASRVASLRSATGAGARCRVLPKLLRCELPRIPAGGRRTLTVGWRSTKGPTYQYAEAKVVGTTPEGDVANNIDFLKYEVTSCTHLGTEAGETLKGTAGADRICASGGGDTIAALAGDDVINGGTGADLIDPGSGRDSVRGNWGNDTILARDGERDVVSCGLDADRVVADAIDVIREDCEQVDLP